MIAMLFSMTSCAVAQTRSNTDAVSDTRHVSHDEQVGQTVAQNPPSSQPSPQPLSQATSEDLPKNLPKSLSGQSSPPPQSLPPQSLQAQPVPPTTPDTGSAVAISPNLQAKPSDILGKRPTPPAETGEVARVSGGMKTETEAQANDDEHPHAWPIDISDQYTEIVAGVPIIENPENCGQGNLEIGVTVQNISKDKGAIVADLHDDVRENFLVWDKVVLRVRAHAHKGEISFCIPLTRPGDYAVAVYHDKNGNKKFDKNFLGIPKERFGMSNNPRFGTRAPKYEEAVFTVPETGKEILIKLRKASDVLGRQK